MPKTKRRSRSRYRSSFISGTCSEFLGAKPLPVLLNERPIVFLLGPSGVGKSMVARRILGEDTTFLKQQEFLDSLALRILLHKWPDTLIETKHLIVEDLVSCMQDRQFFWLSLAYRASTQGL